VETEKLLAKLQARLSEIDRAMFDPASAAPDLAKLKMGDLGQMRAKVAADVEAAEETWMLATEKLEAAD